jgi:hypothetical protein
MAQSGPIGANLKRRLLTDAVEKGVESGIER